MADQKADPHQKQAEQPKAPPKPAALGGAGESGNPLVHQILAERETAIANGDKDRADALTDRLAELGVA